MPCGRNGDRVTGGRWSVTTSSTKILFEAMNRTLKHGDWDNFDLVVGGLAGALPDAFGSCSHRLPDSCVRKTIPGQMVDIHNGKINFQLTNMAVFRNPKCSPSVPLSCPLFLTSFRHSPPVWPGTCCYCPRIFSCTLLV